jgi:hypothetical protein
LKLNKALYGLKQAPRMWKYTLVKFLNELKFKQLKTDMCIFKNQYLIIAIYVDDIVIMGRESKKFEEFKNHKHTKFKTKDLGKLSFLLGIKIEFFNNETLIINQTHYIDRIISRFKQLKDNKLSDIPIQPIHKLTNELLDENENLRTLNEPT